jgi:hypothetical protein
MTSTETQQDDTGGAPAELSADLDALGALATECWSTQALFRLVDATRTTWQGRQDPGVHVVEVDGVFGVMDLNRRAFVPDDYDELTERLRAKLSGLVGDRPLAVGDTTAEVEWESLAIVTDAPQPATTISATASSVPGENGVYFDLVLRADPEGGVDVESYERVGDPADVAAAISAAVAEGAAMGDTAETAESTGSTGSTEDSAGGEEYGGITARYLADYYGSDPVPFENRGYVVDWTTWLPDKQADGGRIGSPMTGRDHDGREHRLYVWFGPDTGAQIVSAEPVAGDAAAVGVEEVFTGEVLPRWFEVCRARESVLETEDGARYDVSRWIGQSSSDHLPELLESDGRVFVVSLRAFTTEEQPTEVRLRLLVEDVERVRVDAVESV